MNNQDKKTSKAREEKIATVAKFSEKVVRAKALVFTNYQGMKHKQLEELKKAVKKLNAELLVTKNTLLNLALKSQKIESEKQTLKSPTATLFIYEDPIAPIKELAKSIKNIKLPLIKFGLLEGKPMNEPEVLRFSTLPTREVLIAQFVGGLKSPIFGLHRALNWNLQKFVMTLKAIEKTKEAPSNQPSATS